MEGDETMDEIATSGGHPASREVSIQRLRNRFEYLALKQEHGTITLREKMELDGMIWGMTNHSRPMP